jgi:hypothetical protein
VAFLRLQRGAGGRVLVCEQTDYLSGFWLGAVALAPASLLAFRCVRAPPAVAQHGLARPPPAAAPSNFSSLAAPARCARRLVGGPLGGAVLVSVGRAADWAEEALELARRSVVPALVRAADRAAALVLPDQALRQLRDAVASAQQGWLGRW